MAKPEALPITIRALEVINEERSSHGLRYSDYARYRKHCSNKIHRLRHVLKLTHGKEKTYKKVAPVPADDVKDGHLLLDLLESERAFTYAQELLAEHAKTQARPVRRHAFSRFRTAISWAKQLRDRVTTLYNAAPPRISATNYAEVVAYHLMLIGRFMRTKDEFQDALTNLAVSRAILSRLSDSAKSSRDQALYAVFIDEIGPEIRHCAHELGRAKAYDIDSIVADVAPKQGERVVEGYAALLAELQPPAGTSSVSDLEPMLWEGQPVPVRSPEIVDAFLRVQQAIKHLEAEGKKRKHGTATLAEHEPQAPKTSRGRIAAFDGILASLSDAEDIARRLSEGQKTGVVPGERDAHFIHAFVQYQLLAYRSQRDLLLVEALLQPPAAGPSRGSVPAQKPTSDARVYPAVIKNLDTIQQSLDQMRSLSITDESQDVASALDFRIAFTRARRCYYLALTHAEAKNYPSSLALVQGAELQLREAQSLLETSTTDTPETAFYSLDAKKDIEELSRLLEQDSLVLRKDWFMYNGGAVESPAGAKSKKPLFFDVAFNYVEPPMDRIRHRAGKAPLPPPVEVSGRNVPTPAPSKKGRIEAEAEPEEEDLAASAPASRGISGFLGSWWGRK